MIRQASYTEISLLKGNVLLGVNIHINMFKYQMLLFWLCDQNRLLTFQVMYLKYVLDLATQTFHGSAGLCVNRIQQHANQMQRNWKTLGRENTYSKHDPEKGDDLRFGILLKPDSERLRFQHPRQRPLSLLIRTTNCTLGYKLNFDLHWSLGSWVLQFFLPLWLEWVS